MSGGNATTAGIDYQQRIAAWCLINQYMSYDISTYFDQIDDELIILETHFETANIVDDINLLCNDKRNIYLQVKRSISLSSQENSEFYKTIKQFVHQFLKSKKNNSFYALITTSDASSKITNDLKKIVLSSRLNKNSFDKNPMNESEKDTLEKIKILFINFYKESEKKDPSSNEFSNFLNRLIIGILDLETGNTVEIATLMLLRSIGFKAPELIWAILIKNSNIYSSQRLSIDKKKLSEIFDKYIQKDQSKTLLEKQNDLFKTEIILQGEYYSTAKDILMIESIIDDIDIMIIELHRFEDDCKMKNVYCDNKIIINENEHWTVIQRFATMKGLHRFIDENENIFKDKKIAIIPANKTEMIEETECAKLHNKYLENLIEKNENPLICLHCEKQIGLSDSLMVEIDDKNLTADVGAVHKTCLRPIDRILGTAQIPEENFDDMLNHFDFKQWTKLLMKGQGMLNAINKSPKLFYGKIPVVAWNGNGEYDSEYSYCIKYILEDGSVCYGYKRNKIERVNKNMANKYLENFVKIKNLNKSTNDPMCALSISKTIGTYSQLIKIKTINELILEIVDAEITKYSNLIAKTFDNDLSYYSPMCIVRDKNEENILNLSNVVPLLSNPLEFNSYISNWEQIGFGLENIELKIIKSDKDFDFYMRQIFKDSMIPIIDPIFDKNFDLVSGIQIRDYDQLTKDNEV